MTRKLILTLATALIAFMAQAQSTIDQVVNDLEKASDVDVTYTERRTAKKHKLYRVTTIINFNNDAYYRKLAKAFEDEREKSVSAVKTRDQRTYKFVDSKGTSSYTLTRNSVIRNWRSSDDKGDEESCVDVIKTDCHGRTHITTTVHTDISRMHEKLDRQLTMDKSELAREMESLKVEMAALQVALRTEPLVGGYGINLVEM